MIIGSFEYDKAKDIYVGEILTLSFHCERALFNPVERKTDREPDYRITTLTAYGHVELGAGWKRVSDSGKDFVSVSLDAPLLAVAVNAALFLDGDDKHASLVWSRQKPKTAAKAQPAAAAKSKKKAA